MPFFGYPKETKGFYFYDAKEQIVFVSRNATFLEEDYILNHVRKGQIAFDELSESPIEPNVPKDNSMIPMQPSLIHQLFDVVGEIQNLMNSSLTWVKYLL